MITLLDEDAYLIRDAGIEAASWAESTRPRAPGPQKLQAATQRGLLLLRQRGDAERVKASLREALPHQPTAPGCDCGPLVQALLVALLRAVIEGWLEGRRA